MSQSYAEKKDMEVGKGDYRQAVWQSGGRKREVHFGIMVVSRYIPAAATAAKSLQSCPTLCDPIDGSPPGSPVPGILQARTLEWGAISLLQCMKVKSESEVAQLCPTLSDPMDCPVLSI